MGNKGGRPRSSSRNTTRPTQNQQQRGNGNVPYHYNNTNQNQSQGRTYSQVNPVTTGQRNAPASSGPRAVRCPRCRRLLQLPEGHPRFLCVCGQMLMSPAAVQQTQRVRCPSCSTTLLPPPGAPQFRCPCGQHLRAPMQSQPSNASMIPKSAGGLSPEEAFVANTLQQRGNRGWTRVLDGDKLRWMRLFSDEEENEMLQLQLNTNENFSEEYIVDMPRDVIAAKLEALGIPVSEKDSIDDLVSKVLVSKQTLMNKPVSELKSLLMNAGADFSNIIEKEDLVDRLFTSVWREEARRFTDGFVRCFDDRNQLTWIPASDFRLECNVPNRTGGNLSAAEVSQVSDKPFPEKMKWLKSEVAKLRIKWDEGHVKVRIHRERLLEDSFTSLLKITARDYHRYFRFEFIGEPGLDAGGVAREWFSLTGDAVFNLDFGLFEFSGVDNICYQINPSSAIANELHLQYFLFVGRLLAKSLFDGQTLNAHLVQTLYKHLLAWPIAESDVEFVDPQVYESFKSIRNCEDASQLYLDFTTAVQEFGETRTIELKPGGEEIDVTNENRVEYLQLLMKHIMLDRVRDQLQHLLVGFYEVMPLPLISVFDYQEIELLFCGLPNIKIQDWKENTKYKGDYQRKGADHKVIKWFWEIIENFSQEQRARFLQFATGTSRVPVQGFAFLQGSDGKIKPFTIDSIKVDKSIFPMAHTCFNRIDLPLYTSKNQAEQYIVMAIQLGGTGFGLE